VPETCHKSREIEGFAEKNCIITQLNIIYNTLKYNELDNILHHMGNNSIRIPASPLGFFKMRRLRF